MSAKRMPAPGSHWMPLPSVAALYRGAVSRHTLVRAACAGKIRSRKIGWAWDLWGPDVARFTAVRRTGHGA